MAAMLFLEACRLATESEAPLHAPRYARNSFPSQFNSNLIAVVAKLQAGPSITAIAMTTGHEVHKVGVTWTVYLHVLNLAEIGLSAASASAISASVHLAKPRVHTSPGIV